MRLNSPRSTLCAVNFGITVDTRWVDDVRAETAARGVSRRKIAGVTSGAVRTRLADVEGQDVMVLLTNHLQ